MNGFNDIQQRLLNDFQHHFPLVRRPFRNIGLQLGLEESEVIAQLSELAQAGAISRIGPVFNPGSIGASTLAALAVPEQHLQETAAWLNDISEINHNYEREHAYNLWFVVTTSDQSRLDNILDRIATHTGYPMLVLPLEERFHIDLGFDLRGHCSQVRRGSAQGVRIELNGAQTAIVAALQSGIRLQPEPFTAIGNRVRMDENSVLDQIVKWQKQGVIKRFGVVVRHHELGYCENAMVVWDMPDDQVADMGRLLAGQECVTLCYRRPRQLPDWSYNLFCMVHGTDRAVVQAQIANLARETGLDAFPSQVLFSRRRFKQHGARYVAEA